MDDMINIKNLDPSRIKVDKKSYKNNLIINKINSTLKKSMEMNN